MANIFAGYVQPRSVDDYRAQMDRGELAQLQLERGRGENAMQALAREQSMAKQNALQALYANPQMAGNPEALERGMLGNPLLMDQGMKLQKGRLDNAKAVAETGNLQATADKTKQGVAAEKRQQTLQHILTLNTPDEARASVQQYVQAGEIDPQMAQMIAQSIPADPAMFPAWQVKLLRGLAKPEAVLSADTSVATNQLTNETSAANNKATNDRTAADNAANRARMAADAAAGRSVQMRGQDLTDARSRELNAATREAAKLKADEKPLNDAQSKAALFGSRMAEADSVLAGLEKQGTTTSIPGARTGMGVGAALNVVSSGNQQKLNQAKRDFVNAVLRRESGAVISDAEFDNAEKQYFPQIGDGEDVKRQKASNRAIAIRGVQAEVPKASRGVIDEIRGGEKSTAGFDADKERRYQEWKAKQK